jgi:hypothetical protein
MRLGFRVKTGAVAGNLLSFERFILDSPCRFRWLVGSDHSDSFTSLAVRKNNQDEATIWNESQRDHATSDPRVPAGDRIAIDEQEFDFFGTQVMSLQLRHVARVPVEV